MGLTTVIIIVINNVKHINNNNCNHNHNNSNDKYLERWQKSTGERSVDENKISSKNHSGEFINEQSS